MSLPAVFICCFIYLFGEVCLAGDKQREKDYADEIGKTLSTGKLVWLESEGNKFYGLYTETENQSGHGTVIILHDQGEHPNQFHLTQALRTYLPEHHWSTLSLQMPLREIGANEKDYYGLFPEALARIETGIKYLQENKAGPIVLAGFGLGGLMAVYARSQKAPEIKALVTISLAVPQTFIKTAQTLDFIKQINIPMLDIYGELDTAEVVESARNKHLAGKHNADYRQIKISNEDHLYQHNQDLVVKRIYSWIERVISRSPGGS